MIHVLSALGLITDRKLDNMWCKTMLFAANFTNGTPVRRDRYVADIWPNKQGFSEIILDFKTKKQ